MNLLSKYDYIYLHGFASSPKSSKAQFFLQKFSELGINLYLPDLNGNDFSTLTLTKQLKLVKAIIKKCNKPIILIGSSMGGLVSTILAEKYQDIKKIILLAPAFKMSQLWQTSITKEKLYNWQISSYTQIFHYGYGREEQLHFDFYLDLFKHEDNNFKRQIPTLIFHGIHDNIVPIEYSQTYIKLNLQAQLLSINDDHNLKKNLEDTWSKILSFIS